MKKFSKITSLDLHVLSEKRMVFLHTQVSEYSIQQALMQLEYLTGLNSKPITLRISSPGGSVDAGLALYDFIKTSKAPILTVVSGMAASMAAVLLAAGKRGQRTATRNSRIMIHQPSGGYIGKATDIEVHAKEVTRIRELLNKLLAEDTRQPFKKVARDTELDYWMTAEEAKKYGLIDRVI